MASVCSAYRSYLPTTRERAREREREREGGYTKQSLLDHVD